MQFLVQALALIVLVTFFAWMVFLRVQQEKRRLRRRDAGTAQSDADK